ncbi:Glycosyltransferase involved in cell wall bisynthesis [Haloechinothrix alba]|uniref:Glycosyltransferase involved in cell wall bisynthesis n=1 Tax=Haloechinothrix alba TaxID=664784 RepID=A0A238X4M3_9PSEU|nr:glycosyltransferase [Haloechinothrix alba]SNR53946.1 Glycosyltransferase involved in cell wall bisynthesis [Haloechinothrix alba]
MNVTLPQQVAIRRQRRILIGADTFQPDVNGAARFAERLATGLAGRGHDVHVICPSTDTRSRTELFHGVIVHRLGSRRTPFHPSFRVCPPWRAGRDLDRIMSEVNPDVVHAQSHFVIGRALVNGATARGIPAVATNHFMPENLLGYLPLPHALGARAARWAWRDLGRVYGRVDAVTAPTPRAVALLRSHGFVHEARAVSCGIDAERYQNNGNTIAGTILFVGRLDKEKRVCELLRAVGLLADPDIRVEIVGDGACRAQLTELAEQLGIAGSVRFHGFIPEQDLLAAYARAEVFCMPGVAELQSIATLEAMSAGKPVVAADAVALPHLVREGVNGWLYRPGDVHGLADRLRRVLRAPGGSARLGAASRLLAGEHALATTLDQFEDVYSEVVTVPNESIASASTPE